jgi:DNA sulfur modification protein DndB
MKIPAIKAQIGSWTYYISTLTFQQVSDHIEKIDDQLHKSESLKGLIQRSITKNYISIREYVLNQDEMFFNSLVLAVYDGTPSWIEVELNYGDEEYFNMGFLDFPEDNQKIFPVDGQHRVEGIKSALSRNPELRSNSIGAIFIGHSSDDVGMQKSRRLFTTLNRYAKPVTMDDIIALDEDDSVAIITRQLLENFNLFKGQKVTKSKNKAIVDSNKEALTSIITLYQCNKELLKLFRYNRKRDNPKHTRDRLSLEKYLKFRPDEEEILLYYDFCIEFWEEFQNNIEDIYTYLNSDGNEPALPFRDRDNGGNLLFRPVGILPFIQASTLIHRRTLGNFKDIFTKLNGLNLVMNIAPWKQVLWNPVENVMIMGAATIVKLLVLYTYGSDVIRSSEIRMLKEKYSSKLGIEEDEDIDKVLNSISIL